jgi:hypothetical protein
MEIKRKWFQLNLISFHQGKVALILVVRTELDLMVEEDV